MNEITFAKNEVVMFMIGGNFSADAGWKHKARYHRGDYELIICVKGPINLLIGNESATLNEHDLLIVPPYTPMKGTVPSSNPIEFYWLHFLLPENHHLHQKVKLEQDRNELTHNADDRPKNLVIQTSYHFQDTRDLLILTHQLLAVDSSGMYSQEQQNLLMTLILIQMANLANKTNFEDKNKTVVNQLKEWIRTNIYRSPTLADIAKETKLNQQYVSRLFKKYVGMSPKHYMIHLKVQTAQALLIRTNLSIKEIGHYSYFSDDKLFMKQFKRISGVTPSSFRSLYQKVYHNNQVIDPVLPIPEEVTQKLDIDRDPGAPKNLKYLNEN
ncbi:AraC family transcriptional regulator [Sporolactobacillus shoreicorticis]|uniref:AraC family transcriptional regulator n=1 Tax=Sporolactobacillus shoreicorticis TaxID=1923877 RepID=A0ABW5S1D5_9BACL|nr:AraC family transcriptional regulator [Sporolactobacillus shoreicorticis]MCO7124655.1 AraC family transcriptional regulator [Sporolactobacillus shoreicorticis]